MHARWETGFTISAAVHEGEIIISANKEGLLSLSNILAGLAEGQPGDHIHLDERNSLEDGSIELVIERVS